MPRVCPAAKMTSKEKASTRVQPWQRVKTKAAANPDLYTIVLNQPAGSLPAGFKIFFHEEICIHRADVICQHGRTLPDTPCKPPGKRTHVRDVRPVGV